MRTTIEKVRAAVVAGAVLVAVVVAGFLTVAHYKAHRLLRDLPERLGADIQKETNGVTYSQSVKGRTIFTMHAARATQHKDGRTGLDNVGIVLYGEKDGRADRIYGKQFEYDEKKGIVRAMGEVQLDLQAPAPTNASARAAYARGEPAAGSTMPKVPDEVLPIHVVTSGLVYVQSLGVASTDQPIRFEYRGMTGQARGAEYNSGTGVTTLQNDVKLSTLRDGRPTVLTAAHAVMERVNHTLTLKDARYLALANGSSDHGASESLRANAMVVHMGEGGEVKSADGSGGVELTSGESRMQSPDAVLRMDADGRPQAAEMTGGVRFERVAEATGGSGEAMEGKASRGTAKFNAKGALDTLQMQGEVQAQLRGAKGETRDLSGTTMDLRMGGAAGSSRRWIEQAVLRGDARVTTELPALEGHSSGSEEMAADVLISLWQADGGTSALRELHGDGHTVIRRRRDGVDEISHGERLRAIFDAGSEKSATRTKRSGLLSAVQEGGVVMDRTLVKKDGATEISHGSAEKATYSASNGLVSLTGGAELSDAESAMRAEQVVLTESTGDAEATGAVQVTYRQKKVGRGEARSAPADVTHEEASVPIHATAERALLLKKTGVASFFGLPKQDARLWQGGSQVEAPRLVFGRATGTLDAYGTEADAMPVHTVLVNKPGAMDACGQTKARQQVVRIESGRLHYADATRRAEFSRGVVLDDANGRITSRDAVATMAAAKKTETPAEKEKKGADGPGGFPGSGLERVVATGEVTLRQPGRVATGEQAVYTAADGMFVLTGVGGVTPKVTDEANGSVTGAALRFRSGDNSVTVEGRAKDGPPETGDGRVHTRTRVKQ